MRTNGAARVKSSCHLGGSTHFMAFFIALFIAFIAFMVLAFMTTLDGFLLFIARRRFMAFIGAASACARFFLAFMAAAFIALARIAFMAAFMAFFIAAAIALAICDSSKSKEDVRAEVLDAENSLSQ